MPFKIELGSKVKDKVTGFTGMVIARSEWLYGCRRYVVQASEFKDGLPVTPCHFDEEALEVTEEVEEPYVMKSTGGPCEKVETTRHSVSAI